MTGSRTLGEAVSSGPPGAKPRPLSEAIQRRMRTTPQRDTEAERLLGRALVAFGLNYQVNLSPVAGSRSRADFVFAESRIAVFMNGCFWHGCPDHGTWPKNNAEWWRLKLEANRKRDAKADNTIRDAGWIVLRFWEHDDPIEAARVVAGVVDQRSAKLNAAPSGER